MLRNMYIAWGSVQLHEGSPPDPIMGQIIPIQYFIRKYTEIKRPKRGADHPPPSSANAKERVQLYLYFPSGPS